MNAFNYNQIWIKNLDQINAVFSTFELNKNSKIRWFLEKKKKEGVKKQK